MGFKYFPLPAGSYTISSPFGPRDGGFHYGMDFAAPMHTPIYAPADGVCVEGSERFDVQGFGRWVWLDCQSGSKVDVIVGHLDPAVRSGDRVRAGQLIGYVNTYGESTGPHAHVEVWTPPGRVGGTAVDPASYFAGATHVTDTNQGRTVDDPVTRIQYSPNCHDGNRNVTWVAVHTQQGNGTAASLTNFLCNPDSEVSYNAVVDDTETVLVVDWDTNPWSAANANTRADHICMAGTFVAWDRGKWLSTDDSDGVDEDVMLTRTAELVAWRCIERGIPIEYVGGGSQPPNRPGVCGHVDFGQWGGGHTDPGPNFPWDELICRAQNFAAGLAGDEMPALQETFENYKGDQVTLGTAVYYLDQYVNEIREQLGGPVPFKGWKQLGDKTVVDSLADAHRKIDTLVTAVDGLAKALTQGAA